MREENFIAFWIVFGFFVGLCVAIVKWNDPFDILVGVMGVTFFFYVIAHMSVGLFIRFMDYGKVRFEKEMYESKLDHFYNQLQQREELIDTRFAAAMSDNGEQKGGR
ncbi:MAG: hypothetical protein GXO33_00790 [Epsilonproteobacteria bacterium]|nr:hypothetical protein [Campylobacterota bacterium]